MEFIDLFPTVILGETLKDITDTDKDLYKDFIKKDSFLDEGINGESSNNQQILSNFLFKKISDNILTLSKAYLREIGHQFQDLQISTSWVNILDAQESIQPHQHGNGYLSGVFYFEESSPISFHHPTSKEYTFKPSYIDTPQSYRSFQTFTITPNPNLLLIFPSWLVHHVLPSQKDNRLSIAFNIIPKGEFGGPTQKLYL